jgi:hypothetical protein
MEEQREGMIGEERANIPLFHGLDKSLILGSPWVLKSLRTCSLGRVSERVSIERVAVFVNWHLAPASRVVPIARAIRNRCVETRNFQL